MGLGLVIAGYLGQFFGNLIKAAVSRQREYLVDASAVQFTRNPTGISGALKRIGGYSSGSIMQHPESEELSHTFFSEGVSFSMAGLLATHPPLKERIQRIEPRWDGQYLESMSPELPSGQSSAMGFAGSTVPVNADEVIAQGGNHGESQIQMARQIIASLPASYVNASHEPYSARALVYLMQLDNDEDIRRSQLEHLKEAADLGVFDALAKLLEDERDYHPAMRLPLLEMSLPTLRQLSYEQYKLFLDNLDVLIKADGRVGLSEWAVKKMVSKHLGGVFERQHPGVRHNSLKSVKQHCEILLSMLAYSDRHAKVSPEEAFSTGCEGLDIDINLVEKKQLSFGALNSALDNLAALHPLRKPKLLKACIRTVTADDVVSLIEQELLRTIADTLECPMPPLAGGS